MKYQLFQYPLPTPSDPADLNAYLDKTKVAGVSHHFLDSPSGPLLVFLVQSLAGGAQGGKSDSRVDYRAVLDPESFARFSRLREERKLIAAEENVPVYAVFTNAQLAEIAREEVNDIQTVAAIRGIGKARVEKWGARILKAMGEVPQVAPLEESSKAK